MGHIHDNTCRLKGAVIQVIRSCFVLTLFGDERLLHHTRKNHVPQRFVLDSFTRLQSTWIESKDFDSNVNSLLKGGLSDEKSYIH